MLSGKKIRVGGIPALQFQVDGKTATFVLGQHKLNILDQFSAVFLGPEFEDSHQVHVTIEGRSKTLYGYTQDPQIVDMFREFLKDNAN